MLQSLCWALLAPTRALLSVRRSVTRLAVAAAAVAAGAAYGLWGLWVLLSSGPRGALSRKVRAEPPPGLEDGTYGQHGWLRLKSSGLRLHYVARGPPGAPLLLLLHGFPQNWFCWRHQLLELGRRFRVVALDLPGYGASEKPPGKENYSPEIVLGDLREAVGVLGGQNGTHKCVLLAAAHPEVVAKLVVMDAPHPHRPTQLLRSSYIFLFQLPWLPELLLSLADFQFLRTLLMGPRLGIQNPSRRMTDPEFEAYLYGLSQPGGLSPPIHYYRNLFGSHFACPILGHWDAPFRDAPIEMLPSGCSHGDAFGMLPFGMLPSGCSHWDAFGMLPFGMLLLRCSHWDAFGMLPLRCSHSDVPIGMHLGCSLLGCSHWDAPIAMFPLRCSNL
uniref:AB hydrolase-1 domain-containing protein n=1 Tax=Gallus gallus TaxID=9031 RepID=A0A8V0XHS3_CHICK